MEFGYIEDEMPYNELLQKLFPGIDDSYSHYYYGVAVGNSIDDDGTPQPTFIVPIKTLTWEVNGRVALRELISANWQNAEFAIAFPALAESSIGLESLDLQSLQNYLYTMSTKVNEDFEVFGLKFDSELFRGWGAFLIFSIQVYFLLHFLQYLRVMDSTVDEVDFPWIGLYPDKWSKLVFLVTVAGFPAGQAIISFTYLINNWQGGGREVSSIFFVALSIVLSIITSVIIVSKNKSNRC